MSIYASLVGTIAQQGQSGGGGGGGGGSSAPTNVSTATSSSGNFDNAVIVDCSTGPGVITANAGNQFSNNGSGEFEGDIELVFGPSYSNALNGNSGVLEFRTFGFIRATNATGFQWGLGGVSEIQDTNGAVSGVGKSGTASTNQDCTSTHMGVEVEITHNSGGRGFLLLSASGDGFSWDLACEASNSNGTQGAATVRPKVLIP